MAPKRLVFTLKSLTPWHHSMAHASFTTHLHSFDGQIATEQQCPHWKHLRGRLTIVLGFQDRPENNPKTAIFRH